MAQIDFSSYSGFSDHTVGIDACLIALSRGARIIEKHFTLSKKMFGPDHAGSAIPIEMKQICDFVKSVEECL
jgi:N,N'-diacetyllegionaminate synthase